jgi:hypothetical protein
MAIIFLCCSVSMVNVAPSTGDIGSMAAGAARDSMASAAAIREVAVMVYSVPVLLFGGIIA